MRTKKVFSLTGIFFLSFILIFAFNSRHKGVSGFTGIKNAPDFPKEIGDILTNSCYDCHATNSQNKMASLMLDFQKWNEYKDVKKANLLSKIDELVSEKSMPPKKYLESNPCKALNDDQIKMVSKWAKDESASLSK
jgi:hypothetical protein